MVHGANRGQVGERKTRRPTNEHDLVFDYDVKVIVAFLSNNSFPAPKSAYQRKKKMVTYAGHLISSSCTEHKRSLVCLLGSDLGEKF